MDDKTRALLGDREAAKRLTDAGVVLMQGDCLELSIWSRTPAVEHEKLLYRRKWRSQT